MDNYPYKLSAINRMLESELLPKIKKQQVFRILNQDRSPLKEGKHYRKEQRERYNVYYYSDQAVSFFRDWAIKYRYKSQLKQR